MKRGAAAAAIAATVLALNGAMFVATSAPAHAEGRAVWTACVTDALVSGRATDANVQACDRAYAAATGDATVLWLYCPSLPEAGGCEARTGARPSAQ